MSELPAGPGWYEDEHDPLLLRYFDGVVWTSNTTPRRSPTADASTIGRATPGVIPGRAGNPGAWSQPGHQGQSGPQAPGQWQGGGAPPTDYNPYQQGWVSARKDVLPDGSVLAEWWRRLIGRTLDLVVVGILAVVFAFPWVSRSLSTMSDFVSDSMAATESGATPPSQTEFALQFLENVLPVVVIWVVVSLVYETTFLAWRSATPGKMLVGTVVRPRDGAGRISVLTALKRELIPVSCVLLNFVPIVSIFAFVLLVVDPAWLLWDPKRQALHDKVADTVVVLRHPQG